jgi:hypothetical protein
MDLIFEKVIVDTINRPMIIDLMTAMDSLISKDNPDICEELRD